MGRAVAEVWRRESGIAGRWECRVKGNFGEDLGCGEISLVQACLESYWGGSWEGKACDSEISLGGRAAIHEIINFRYDELGLRACLAL